MFIHALGYFTLWLHYVAFITAGVSGIIRFRRLPLSLRYVALVAIFDMVMESTLEILIRVIHLKSNLFLTPVVVIGEVLLLSLAYREVLQSATFNRLMPWVVGLFSCYTLADTFTKLGIVRYAISVELTANLLLFGLAMLYFWKLLSELRVEHLRKDPFFWVSTGLVIYVLGTSLITLFSNYLLAHYSHNLQVLVMLDVNRYFVITSYLTYSLALWMRPQQSTSLSY